MNTYAMQTVHGRAAAISTGCKVANPKPELFGRFQGTVTGWLSVVTTLSMPSVAISTMNMLLLNNRIYGLTKGQYSPTSPRGFVSKSSPYGTVEDPFHPAELCFGARGRFFARCGSYRWSRHSEKILKAAANHKGAAVCEILQTLRYLQ